MHVQVVVPGVVGVFSGRPLLAGQVVGDLLGGIPGAVDFAGGEKVGTHSSPIVGQHHVAHPFRIVRFPSLYRGVSFQALVFVLLGNEVDDTGRHVFLEASVG